MKNSRNKNQSSMPAKPVFGKAQSWTFKIRAKTFMRWLKVGYPDAPAEVGMIIEFSGPNRFVSPVFVQAKYVAGKVAWDYGQLDSPEQIEVIGDSVCPPYQMFEV